MNSEEAHRKMDSAIKTLKETNIPDRGEEGAEVIKAISPKQGMGC